MERGPLEAGEQDVSGPETGLLEGGGGAGREDPPLATSVSYWGGQGGRPRGREGSEEKSVRGETQELSFRRVGVQPSRSDRKLEGSPGSCGGLGPHGWGLPAVRC